MTDVLEPTEYAKLCLGLCDKHLTAGVEQIRDAYGFDEQQEPAGA